MENSINIENILETKKKNKKSHFKTYILSFTVLLVLGLSGFLYYSSLSNKVETINSYVELKIIDKDGVSVPGAQVYINNNLLGVSDSFGEVHNNLDTLKDSDLIVIVVKSFFKQDEKFSFKIDSSKNIIKTLQI